MQAKLVGVVFPKGGRRAALLMRRGDGQFAISGIDARLGSACYAAARLPARRADPVAAIKAGGVAGG